MANRGRYSQELRERAVRLVAEQENQHGSQWETITSVAEKIGCSAETLRKSVRPGARTQEETPGMAAGLTYNGFRISRGGSSRHPTAG